MDGKTASETPSNTQPTTPVATDNKRKKGRPSMFERIFGFWGSAPTITQVEDAPQVDKKDESATVGGLDEPTKGEETGGPALREGEPSTQAETLAIAIGDQVDPVRGSECMASSGSKVEAVDDAALTSDGPGSPPTGDSASTPTPLKTSPVIESATESTPEVPLDDEAHDTSSPEPTPAFQGTEALESPTEPTESSSFAIDQPVEGITQEFAPQQGASDADELGEPTPLAETADKEEVSQEAGAVLPDAEQVETTGEESVLDEAVPVGDVGTTHAQELPEIVPTTESTPPVELDSKPAAESDVESVSVPSSSAAPIPDANQSAAPPQHSSPTPPVETETATAITKTPQAVKAEPIVDETTISEVAIKAQEISPPVLSEHSNDIADAGVDTGATASMKVEAEASTSEEPGSEKGGNQEGEVATSSSTAEESLPTSSAVANELEHSSPLDVETIGLTSESPASESPAATENVTIHHLNTELSVPVLDHGFNSTSSIPIPLPPSSPSLELSDVEEDSATSAAAPVIESLEDQDQSAPLEESKELSSAPQILEIVGNVSDSTPIEPEESVVVPSSEEGTPAKEQDGPVAVEGEGSGAATSETSVETSSPPLSEPEGNVVDQTAVAPITAPRDPHLEVDLPSVSTAADVVADEGAVSHVDAEEMVASSLGIPETASDEVKAVALDGETQEGHQSESGPTDEPEGKVDSLAQSPVGEDLSIEDATSATQDTPEIVAAPAQDGAAVAPHDSNTTLLPDFEPISQSEAEHQPTVVEDTPSAAESAVATEDSTSQPELEQQVDVVEPLIPSASVDDQDSTACDLVSESKDAATTVDEQEQVFDKSNEVDVITGAEGNVIDSIKVGESEERGASGTTAGEAAGSSDAERVETIEVSPGEEDQATATSSQDTSLAALESTIPREEVVGPADSEIPVVSEGGKDLSDEEIKEETKEMETARQEVPLESSREIQSVEGAEA